MSIKFDLYVILFFTVVPRHDKVKTRDNLHRVE
jgi:hypothetical protein